jgi:hypothetical protein
MRIALVILAASTLSPSLLACRDKEAAPAAPAPSSTPVTGAAPARVAESKATAATFSCDRRKMQDEDEADTCIDFSSDAVQKGLDYIKRPCNDPAAVFAPAPCPTQNVVATCESQGKNLFRYYGDGKMKWTAESAKKQCTKQYGGKIL